MHGRYRARPDEGQRGKTLEPQMRTEAKTKSSVYILKLGKENRQIGFWEGGFLCA